MSNGDEGICKSVREYVIHNEILDQEVEIQHATKFCLKSGAHRVGILVYNSGRIHVDGADSELKKWCIEVKKSIEDGTGAPGILLPAEIERLPDRLREKVTGCDDVIIWFYQESLRCYKAGSAAGSAFMLGAASEKAVLLLIDTYASRIGDEKNREKFLSRINGRMISVKYDEFRRSQRSASPKIENSQFTQDLEQMVDGAFNFYRATRNQVGHPQIVPDLDRGVILANIGQFVVYVERIYALINFFEANEIKV